MCCRHDQAVESCQVSGLRQLLGKLMGKLVRKLVGKLQKPMDTAVASAVGERLQQTVLLKLMLLLLLLLYGASKAMAGGVGRHEQAVQSSQIRGLQHIRPPVKLLLLLLRLLLGPVLLLMQPCGLHIRRRLQHQQIMKGRQVSRALIATCQPGIQLQD